MRKLMDLEQGLLEGAYHQELSRVYGADATRSTGRLSALLRGFYDVFGQDGGRSAALFSTPGRTEIGGNHTDHQHGLALASSVNLDTIACVCPTDTGIIRIQSQHHRMCEVDLGSLAPVAGELGHSTALVRGVAARISDLGYPVGGFDAYTTTRVLRGSGLSSSATFEVLVATILNHLYCGGALSATELAQVGQYAENAYYGKPCGLMDQLACATGGVIAIDFAQPEAPAIRQVDFDLHQAGYALCIVDSGVSHAGLHTEYAAIPQEMGEVAACFGRKVLGEVTPTAFYANLAAVRESCGDRAVLRAIHSYTENSIVEQELQAVQSRDMDAFLELVRQSGRSSWMFLQNVSTCRDPKNQGLGVLLAAAEQLLGREGACRVHGGGFAGTIQAFVPLRRLDTFRRMMERISGPGSCHVLSFRSSGTCTLIS